MEERADLGRSGIVVGDGPLAQLVAHLHDAQGVVGSSPARPTEKVQVRGATPDPSLPRFPRLGHNPTGRRNAHAMIARRAAKDESDR